MREGAVKRVRLAARLSVALAAVLLVLIAPGAGPSPAVASCAPARPVAEAVRRGDIVFVGTVTRLENAGRWITVRVEERWRALVPIPDVVTIRGGPEAGAATSVDRTYLQGRYLFIVTAGPESFLDDACSATTPWTDDLARLRTAGVSPAPEVAGNEAPRLLDQLDLVPVAALVAALLIAVTAYLFILRARRRPPDWMR
jgi:hypothetical protein